MKKNKRKTFFTLGFLFVLVILTFLLTVNMTYLFIPDLSTRGYVKVTPKVRIEDGSGFLMLRSDCKEVVISISPWQAESIERGIEGKSGIRPNAHDLIASLFKDYGIEVLMAKVTHLKDGTYYAKLMVKKGNRILGLDARPSDAIAIATRTSADIFVKEELLKDVCS